MQINFTTVGIVFGGISEEHEVSIKSAKTIFDALKDNTNISKFKVICFYINKQGIWLPSDLSEQILDKITPPDNDVCNKSLVSNVLTGLHQNISKVDVWFSILHGPNGEDGAIQGLFKLTGKPFVGSNILGSALGMDKIAMKAAFYAANLPQIEYLSFNSKDFITEEILFKLVEQIESKLQYPCFIKPANLGSSIGISKAYNIKELKKGLKKASNFDERIVVEKNVQARELECAVIGKEKMVTSCVGEIIFQSDWYDYQTKYADNTSNVLIPAPIPKGISKKVKELSIMACKALSVEGIARVDFFYEEEKGDLLLNEVNTMPGFTSKSMFPMLWEASGINLPQLVSRLIDSAKE